MRKSLWLSLVAPALVAGLTSAAAQATAGSNLEAELSVQLPDHSETRLFKHHRHLFAVGANSDDTISIYAANKQGTDWQLMDGEAESIADFVASTSAVDNFALHGNDLYAGTVSRDGVAEVWSIALNSRPAVWERVGASGLGEDSNTRIVDLFRVAGQGLYALTENAAGNGLFQLEDGSWNQVGEYGLGVELSDAVAAGHIRVVGDVVNIASASGAIYQANKADLATWSVVNDFGVEITAMRGRFVATAEDGVVKVYEADEANAYTMVGQADLDNDTNEAVVRFVNITRHPTLLVKNSVDGAAYYHYDVDSETWTATLVDGFGNANNTSVTDLVQYRGDRYVATVNATDGSEIYRLER